MHNYLVGYYVIIFSNFPGGSIVCIIESVDSISRDGPATPIMLYTIQYKMPKFLDLIAF